MCNASVKLWRHGLISLMLIAAGTLTVLGDQQPAAPGAKPVKRAAADVGKRVAETSAREIVARAADGPPAKPMIEAPAKAILAGGSDPFPASLENPKVQPGLVRWHADFDAARAAALKSGKPVLLFHMLGRLDDRFC